MKTNSTYRRIIAFLLAVLVFQAVALKEIHHLLDHHHEQVAHCDDTKGGESHLHNEEYVPVDCSICFLNFAPATLDFQVFSVKTPVGHSNPKTFSYQKPLATRVNWHFQHRGPPALAA